MFLVLECMSLNVATNPATWNHLPQFPFPTEAKNRQLQSVIEEILTDQQTKIEVLRERKQSHILITIPSPYWSPQILSNF